MASDDRDLETKAADIIGLYLDPPASLGPEAEHKPCVCKPLECWCDLNRDRKGEAQLGVAGQRAARLVAWSGPTAK